jgi:cellulose synthase/poly-beta-1,6-N-acetylglucosamine synthase-like glycosyltransferase
VCSGCNDNTVKIVKEHTEKDSRVKVFVENQRQGKASAINHILGISKGDLIIFISADTLPEEKCFAGLTSKFSDEGVGLVCGKPQPVNNSNGLSGTLVNTLWGSHDYIFRSLNKDGLARHASEVFCIRAGIIKAIPNDTINDDAFLALAILKKGWHIEYDPQSTVLICGPKNFPDYYKQRSRVLLGHRQIKSSTGESPQHLVYLLPLYPKKVLKLFFGLCKDQGLLTFAFFTLTELLINMSLLPSLVKSKPLHNNWSIASSTKEVVTQIKQHS